MYACGYPTVAAEKHETPNTYILFFGLRKNVEKLLLFRFTDAFKTQSNIYNGTFPENS